MSKEVIIMNNNNNNVLGKLPIFTSPVSFWSNFFIKTAISFGVNNIEIS